MPLWTVKWSARGVAVIDADDAEEAEQILDECLTVLDSSMFEAFDVDDVSVDSVSEGVQ